MHVNDDHLSIVYCGEILETSVMLNNRDLAKLIYIFDIQLNAM